MRTALVSGGASGIGRACADRLSAEGVRVVTADLDILANSGGIIGPNGLRQQRRQGHLLRNPWLRLSIRWAWA
ncbi:hypothetical protein [Nonomuraea dietziae]|uniref:hypothetical protein n=1 Tax=Nonomuraea dietziae TaxID=65515 RepID=UPI00342F8092